MSLRMLPRLHSLCDLEIGLGQGQTKFGPHCPDSACSPAQFWLHAS